MKPRSWLLYIGGSGYFKLSMVKSVRDCRVVVIKIFYDNQCIKTCLSFSLIKFAFLYL